MTQWAKICDFYCNVNTVYILSRSVCVNDILKCLFVFFVFTLSEVPNEIAVHVFLKIYIEIHLLVCIIVRNIKSVDL